jgi:predicted PurR-regulated permease PerM
MIKDVLKYFFTFLAAVIIIALIWYFKTVVIYVLLAVIFSLIGQPFVNFFNRIKIGKYSFPPAASALGAMMCIFLILFFFIALFVPLIVQEAKIIASINPYVVINSLKEPLANIEYTIQQYVPGNNYQSIQGYVQDKLISVLTLAQLSNFFNQFITIMGDFFVAVFAVSFITFFFLKDQGMFYNFVVSVTPSKHEAEIKNIMAESKSLLTRYFIGICTEVILIIALVGIGLSFLGINNAFIIALLSGVLNIIPYVGPLIGLGVGVLVGISTNLPFEAYHDSLIPLITKISTVFIIVQLLDGLLLAPLIYSNSVKAHPLEIFITLLIAGNIGGIGAMIIAIPAYTVIRIVARQFFNNFRLVQRITKNLDN